MFQILQGPHHTPMQQDSNTVSVFTRSNKNEYVLGDTQKIPTESKWKKISRASLKTTHTEAASLVPTLAPHPRAKKFHLGNEIHPTRGLERKLSQVSLLRGLSSDPIWAS